jgi:hypothetical protein
VGDSSWDHVGVFLVIISTRDRVERIELRSTGDVSRHTKIPQTPFFYSNIDYFVPGLL